MSGIFHDQRKVEHRDWSWEQFQLADVGVPANNLSLLNRQMLKDFYARSLLGVRAEPFQLLIQEQTQDILCCSHRPLSPNDMESGLLCIFVLFHPCCGFATIVVLYVHMDVNKVTIRLNTSVDRICLGCVMEISNHIKRSLWLFQLKSTPQIYKL